MIEKKVNKKRKRVKIKNKKDLKNRVKNYKTKN